MASRVQLASTPVEPALSSDTHYAVGYGRPPKHSQFQKGKSGNTGGRPPGAKNARTLAKEQLGKKTTVKIDGKPRKMSMLEIALQQQIKRAVEKGDLKSLIYMLSLSEGDSGDPASSPRLAHSVRTHDDPIAPQDLQILAHHRREQMLARGLASEVVDCILREQGLLPAPEEQQS